MDQNAGTRLRPRIDDRMENFLQSFRATTEKFLADLGSLLSETVLAFKDSSEAVHTTLTDGMEKIAVTLTQMNDQFKESSMNRNDAEAKERAKIQFYWNEPYRKEKTSSGNFYETKKVLNFMKSIQRRTSYPENSGQNYRTIVQKDNIYIY